MFLLPRKSGGVRRIRDELQEHGEECLTNSGVASGHASHAEHDQKFSQQ